METRGEKSFIKMQLIPARIYDWLTDVKGVNEAFIKISNIISGKLIDGRLLEIGFGPGRLLEELRNLVPQLELHGLDISASMLKIAYKRLGTKPELRLGSIEKSNYSDDFFDCIVCSCSFYNWDNPVEGLNEMYRILKPGQTAFLFETTRDFDPELLGINLQNNLVGYGQTQRILSTVFLKKQLKMTYSTAEFNELILQSKFKDNYNST